MLAKSSVEKLRFVVVGAGKTAVDISQIIVDADSAELAALLGDSQNDTAESSLSNQAKILGVPYLETSSLSSNRSLEFVSQAAPHYVISANNFLLFKQPMLDIATIATINFHNGPLPDYAGLNPFCWAIINGDSNYGISWHIVETGIDSGPVLHLAQFDLGPNPRAITTLIKCIREGIRSFKEFVLPKLLNRDVSGTPQDTEKRMYFSKNQIPFNGRFPWWEANDVLGRWTNALAFSPLPNMFYRPTLQVANCEPIVCDRIRFTEYEQHLQPGTIRNLDANSIIITTPGGYLSATGFYTKDGQPTNPLQHGLAVGKMLIGKDS